MVLMDYLNVMGIYVAFTVAAVFCNIVRELVEGFIEYKVIEMQGS